MGRRAGMAAATAAAMAAAMMLAGCSGGTTTGGPAAIGAAAPTTSGGATPGGSSGSASGGATSSGTTSPTSTPVPGAPWVVSLGDSFISGEAGRWAGNSDTSNAIDDALGPTAYYDNPSNTGELIPLCHRSKSAMIHIGQDTKGDPVNSLNLACSGAKTTTFTDSDGDFKPGLDFYSTGGRQGQALMLQQFASANDVRMVVVSIGGNDFGFGPIATACVKAFVFDENYCQDDPAVTKYLQPSFVEKTTANIAVALQNVRKAMQAAGKKDGTWSLVVNLNPDTLPRSGDFRYPQTETRQSTGGCGFYNTDADWAATTLVTTIRRAQQNALGRSGVTPSAVLDLSSALAERQLCSTSTSLVENTPGRSWKAAGAVDLTEWSNQVFAFDSGPHFSQESLHPSYWGQLAFRSCVRQAWNDGSPKGGACTRSADGLSSLGEPVMTLS